MSGIEFPELPPVEPTPPEITPFRPTFPEPPVKPKPPTKPKPPAEPIGEPGEAGGGQKPPVPPPKPAPSPKPGGGGGGGISDVGTLAKFLIILGLILLAKALTDFLNWLRKKLFPRSRTAPVTTATVLQPLSNALGSAAAEIDAEIARTFLTLASEGVSASRLAVRLATVDRALATRIAGLTAGSHSNTAHTAAASAAARTAAVAASAAQATAQATAHTAKQAEGRLQREERVTTEYITHLLEPELDTLRSRIGELEKGVSTAWDELMRVEGFFDDPAVAALVAGGIAALGGSWIFCEATALLGDAACGLGRNRVGNLLGSLLAIVAAVDPCTVIAGLTYLAESGAAQGALDFLAGIGSDLLSCAGGEKAGPLNSAYYSPGPVTMFGAPGAVGV